MLFCVFIKKVLLSPRFSTYSCGTLCAFKTAATCAAVLLLLSFWLLYIVFDFKNKGRQCAALCYYLIGIGFSVRVMLLSHPLYILRKSHTTSFLSNCALLCPSLELRPRKSPLKISRSKRLIIEV